MNLLVMCLSLPELAGAKLSGARMPLEYLPSKEKRPGEDVSTGPAVLNLRIYLFGLFGTSAAFGSACVAALAAMGLPVSLPKRVK
jgi:hypothetical protein